MVDLATAILKQLTRLSAGSCSCGTKSPDIQWHDAGCRYRLAEETRENVEALESQRAEEWRKRREAEGSRDVAKAACATMRQELEAAEAEVSRLTKRVEEAAETPAYDAIDVPADIEEFGERHGIPVFGTATYRNGYLAGFRAACDLLQKNGDGNG